MECEIGILGGTGFYKMVEGTERPDITTRYGDTSSAPVLGELAGRRVAFIARHGKNHSLAPHNVPYRANIDALCSLGARRVIATTAIGSLHEEYAPGDIVFFDQFVNMTRSRPDTFFDDKGGVVHVNMAEPYCSELRAIAIEQAVSLGIKHHSKGTVVAVEGPRFSTKAESKFFAAQGFHTICMTQYPEAALARERQLCYLGIGIVTDYDSGVESAGATHSSFYEISRVFGRNVEKVCALIEHILPAIPEKRESCACPASLDGAAVKTP